ncbi:ferritin family protein [Dethiothermospora halolimnae]|uniref:ferritin family protein n=1 Tax=Dethiothermospora halolimnae TaxID=3114390 RepID=UPI003CCC0422
MDNTKCLICGMNITANSYNLNNSTFINENKKENIINCPFCGVDIIYIDKKKDIYDVDEDKLNAESLKILDKAMKLEVFNGEFYREASKLAKDKKVKKMLKDLSNIEFMHAKIHKRLGGFKELPKLRKPDYTKHNTDQLLLIEANKREKHAISFYNRKSKEISNEIIIEVFKALSDVEKQHMVITDKKD